MLIQGQTGPIASTGNNVQVPVRIGQLGDVITSDLQPRYYEQTYRGNSYMLTLSTAAAITAYVGGAAGTPALTLYNPVGSGKNAVITKANMANVVAASAAGTVAIGLWTGVTAAISGTQVQPTNCLTLVATGSAMYCVRNTAATGSTAATNVIPLGSYYWATAAGAIQSSGAPVDLEGSIIIPPGCYAALGGSSALTSATWLASLQWNEVPV